MTSDIGNGNGTVTKGVPSLAWNGRLLYKITDSLALGIDLAREGHDIKNVDPAPVDFGRSDTLSGLVVLELSSPLWPIFASSLSHYPMTPYGVIGIGQNKNSFTENSAFSNSCKPASACSVALENTLAVMVAAGVDYFISPDFSINAELGWKLNSGKSHISTTNSIISNDSYEASTASLLVGIRYFFGKPKSSSPRPVAPPQIFPTIMEVTPPPKESWVTKDIFFESSSWAITSEWENLLLEVSYFLRSSPKIPIEIEGHTDLHGSKKENLRISQKRAEAVERILKEAGVTNTMRVIAYGDSHPISKEDTPEADRLNRRVTIRRLDK